MKLRIVSEDFRSSRVPPEMDYPFKDVPHIGSEVEILDPDYGEQVAIVKTIHYERITGEPTVIVQFDMYPGLL